MTLNTDLQKQYTEMLRAELQPVSFDSPVLSHFLNNTQKLTPDIKNSTHQ